MVATAARVLDGPLGPVHAVASAEGVVRLHHLGETGRGDVPRDAVQPGVSARHGTGGAAGAHLELLAGELADYAAGGLREFTVPLDLDGAGVHDAFARAVYEEIRAVPYGETAAYGEISRDAGHPRRARLVGRLCRLVPVELVIPVHRIVRADGGFGENGAARRALVERERAVVFSDSG